MSSRTVPTPLHKSPERAERGVPAAGPSTPPPAAGRFDKAFPVFLEGERGVAAGVGRNITATGMFVETREPFPLGSRVKVTFSAPSGGAEMVLEGEVRYQCFINFAKPDHSRAGMRGIGLKFVAPALVGDGRRGTLH